MVISDSPKIRLEVRVYDKNSRAAFLVNDDTGRKIRIAKFYTLGNEFVVENCFQGRMFQNKKEAVTEFRYIITIVCENVSFLFEGSVNYETNFSD